MTASLSAGAAGGRSCERDFSGKCFLSNLIKDFRKGAEAMGKEHFEKLEKREPDVEEEISRIKKEIGSDSPQIDNYLKSFG